MSSQGENAKTCAVEYKPLTSPFPFNPRKKAQATQTQIMHLYLQSVHEWLDESQILSQSVMRLAIAYLK